MATGRTADLVRGIRSGDRRVLARAISLVADEAPESDALLASLHTSVPAGTAHLVGITGSPGVGKSTLTFRLAQEIRAQGRNVGIVAVDPTSPFTGGALLGDRVRMQELSIDPGVFIRSLATRGAAGGLARRTGDVLRLLEAAGFGTILVETIGTGQAEVDVVRLVHTVVVVLAPGLGDEVQASKAGILEIGDLFVVNKADREGADRTVTDIEGMLALGQHQGWKPPVLKATASEGTGVKEVLAGIRDHLSYLETTGRKGVKERHRVREELIAMVSERLRERLLAGDRERELESKVDDILARRCSPGEARDALIAGPGNGKGEGKGPRGRKDRGASP